MTLNYRDAGRREHATVTLDGGDFASLGRQAAGLIARVEDLERRVGELEARNDREDSYRREQDQRR